jgi:hypothetical protein
LFQAQTFGGVYSDELLIHAAPDLKAAGRRNRAGNCQLVLYSRAFQCGQALLSPTRQECVEERH